MYDGHLTLAIVPHIQDHSSLFFFFLHLKLPSLEYAHKFMAQPICQRISMISAPRRTTFSGTRNLGRSRSVECRRLRKRVLEHPGVDSLRSL